MAWPGTRHGVSRGSARLLTEFVDLERALRPGDERQGTNESVERSTGIVVAGMHRSGTSAIVRVLNLLGVDLPAALYPARPDNPVGYWEPLQVVEAR